MSLPKLTPEDVQAHMEHLPGWSYVDDKLCKQFKFKNFMGSIRFVNQIASAAESVNHHPDIYVRYDHVTLTLWSHDAGGVTLSDTQLAASCDDVADMLAA
jgi:4a-hydroxytetrahydrobiopterin dehydratase